MAYEGCDSDTVVDETSQPAVSCIETGVDCQHNVSPVPCCAGDGHGRDDALRIAWRYKNLHLPVE